MNILSTRNLIPALILFWILLLPMVSQSQNKKKQEAEKTEEKKHEPTQKVRLELEEKSFESDLNVFPLPDSTLLIYKQPYFGSFKEEHVFQRYSRDLQLLWTDNLLFEDSPEFHQIYTTRKSIYLLYLSNITYKFSILKINIKTGAHTLTNYNLKNHDLDTDIRLGHFKVLRDNIFISAASSRNSLVVHINEATQDIKTIPALYDQLDALEEFHIDTLAKRAEFILSETNGIKGRLQVKRFTPIGELYSNTLIQPPFGRNLITAQLTPGDSVHKLILGTYSNRDTRFSQGFFTSQLTSPGTTLNYIDFIQLKHFFDFLNKRAQRKLQEKAARFKSEDKDLRHRYRLLFHDIVKRDNIYYLFTEVFTSQGNSSFNRWPGYYNRIYSMDRYFPMVPMSNRSANSEPEFRYSHAIICAFNPEGKLLWDNSYVLNDVVRNDLNQHTQYGFAGDRIVMAYPYKDEIRYKIVTGDSTSENDLSVPLAGKTPEEKVTSVEGLNLVHWYGPHFLASGFGRIKPPKGAAREVFILNKVSFEIKD